MKLPKSFAWLNATQFFGALNDNVFKLLVVFFILNMEGEDGASPETVIASSMAVFVLPFLLFSHAGGLLADRVSKRTIIVAMKLMEIGVMVTGAAAILVRIPGFAYTVIFLMATQSALFGPSKYGIIPELVGRDRISKANGMLVGISYLAIILGTFVPSLFLSVLFPGNYMLLAVVCIVFATCGFACSRQIEHTPAGGATADFSPRFITEIIRILRRCAADRHLLLAIIGSAYFLFLAGYIQQNIILYAKEELGWAWEDSGFLFPIAALGIVCGAFLCGRLSGRNVELGLVPLGAVGLTLSCVALFFFRSLGPVCVWIFLIGLSSGLFIVPLNSFIQYRSPRHQLGENLAANNFLSFAGLALSSGLIKGSDYVPGFTSRMGFLVAGILTLFLSIVAVRALPDFLVRLFCVLLTRFCYRIRAFGMQHVPIEGAALLVSNHVTWVDAFFIMATQQRRVRYLMYRPSYENRYLKPLYRLMGVIPIAGEDSPKQILESIKYAREALAGGYLVCVFAEGALTRNGNMRKFKPGFERIVRGTDVPIIPVHVGGAWGSIFSYYHGKPLTTINPLKFPYPVTVHFGEPMPTDSGPEQVRLRVSELAGETIKLLKHDQRTLARMFVHSARKNFGRRAMSDTTGKDLSFGKCLIGSLALADVLAEDLREQQRVGVIMPASVGGALLNIALTLLGKVPINLNFTTSADSMASAIEQSGVRTTISSRAFLEKLEDFDPPDGLLYMEDIMQRVTGGVRIRSLAKALFAPMRWLLAEPGVTTDDLATIIFSSGSTAEPKGIMLSHHNITSNIEGFSDLMHFREDDRMCASLPFFHSFGFTVTLWCPLICGFRVTYHPNPVDGATIAKVVRENQSTILLSTPTFLMAYIRRAKREDFESLRYVVTGAEKLKKRIADAFEKQFGIRPLEGYGTTELSPAVSVNIPDIKDDLGQVGTKDGSIGHPIPGITIRIADPDSLETLPHGAEGLVLVKGPNVMLGYLDQPDKTSEAVVDGWYNTGDIGRMDDDGFVVLVDRLSRFSKIGGEMVPHLAIEEKYHDALGATQQVVVVTSLPDERKGEKLIVLFTPEAGDAKGLHKAIESSDMPNLWKPRAQNYLPIEAIPVLGSGKLDLKTIRQFAIERLDEQKGVVKKVTGKIKGALNRESNHDS